MDAKARADCIKEIDLLKVKALFKKCAPIIKGIPNFLKIDLRCPLLPVQSNFLIFVLAIDLEK